MIEQFLVANVGLLSISWEEAEEFAFYTRVKTSCALWCGRRRRAMERCVRPTSPGTSSGSCD